MPDFAVSADPAVQRQLDRLDMLSPGGDILGLERITALLARLGDPHHRLPPVFHVAGTNGKGSTCAFLRAAIEAAGHTAHVYTSPHLVRFNERIRLAGRLIDDAALAALLEEVLDAADGIGASFFEITTAAAFLAFSRTAAAACIVEVGLGGRLDATNVVAAPAVTAIAQLGLDHQAFLGTRLTDIAAEKAGIAKPGATMLTLHYPAAAAERIGQTLRRVGTRWLAKGAGWDAALYRGRLHYKDAAGDLDLPAPRLPGGHQALNAGLAVAMLRHQTAVNVPASAMRAAMGWAEWPGRLQRLEPGPLLDRLPPGSALWLDGAHNPAAAKAVADHFRGKPGEAPLDLILGILVNKDARGIIAPFAARGALLRAVPVTGHAHHEPAALVELAREMRMTADAHDHPLAALDAIAQDDATPRRVLIAGSLYLAGAMLDANGTLPN